MLGAGQRLVPESAALDQLFTTDKQAVFIVTAPLTRSALIHTEIAGLGVITPQDGGRRERR
jgi:hypothetical protein